MAADKWDRERARERRAHLRRAAEWLRTAPRAEAIEFLRRFAEESACSGAEEIIRFAQGPGTNAYLAEKAERQIRREARAAVPWVIADVLVDAAGDILLSSSLEAREPTDPARS